MKFRNIAFSMFALILPCFIFIGCGETNLINSKNYDFSEELLKVQQ